MLLGYAIPNNQGQTNPPVGVDQMQAGYWSGKGKNVTWISELVPAGETVVDSCCAAPTRE